MAARAEKQIAPRSRQEWRRWLERNHASTSEVWLVFYKLHTGASTLTYNDAVEEALCFGWIDGVRRRLDDERYIHRLSPRKPDSKWSGLNRARAGRMIKAGLMKPSGLQAIKDAKRSGNWTPPPKQRPADSAEFASRLKKDRKAAEFFSTLSPSCQRQYTGWIAVAKREETRTRRIEEALKLLAAGEKLGMR